MIGWSHDADAELEIGNPNEHVVHEIPWRSPERALGPLRGRVGPNPWAEFMAPLPAAWPVRWLWRLFAGRQSAPASRPQPRRVVLSHTSDLRSRPADRSFVAAAEAAVCRAGDAIVDMEYLTAADAGPADRSASMVASADIYVGIIGRRYGSLVPGRTDQSFTELEFETATLLGIPRLIFIIQDDQLAVADQKDAHSQRQDAFRNRLSAVVFATVASPAELEIDLYQALTELSAAMPQPAGHNRRPRRQHGFAPTSRWMT